MDTVSLADQGLCDSGKTTEAQGAEKTLSKPIFINTRDEIFEKMGKKGKE